MARRPRRGPLAAALVLAACTRTSPRAAADAGAPSAAPDTDAGAPAPAARDTEAARAAREALVARIREDGYLKTERVADAMKRVPRHLFVPSASVESAYGDWPLPIGFGQTISQPSVVSEMTEALELTGDERVLEIGTGSGYQAAVLALLAAEVYTIEIVPELGARAQALLRDLGYENVHARVGDGYAGWPEAAPFDRVILTAAPPKIPDALVAQLAEGGVLVAPEGGQKEGQWLVRLRKRGGKTTREKLERVQFVPMVRGR